MTPPDIARLKELAEKATPGPYIRYGTRVKFGPEDCIQVGPDGFAILFLPIGQPRQHAEAFCDGAYFAALDPATVLWLCEAAEKLELLGRAVKNDHAAYKAVCADLEARALAAEALADRLAEGLREVLDGNGCQPGYLNTLGIQRALALLTDHAAAKEARK